MQKSYQVFYILKYGKREEINHIFIMANNQREALKECKRIVKEKTGKNAFRPTCKCSDLVK